MKWNRFEIFALTVLFFVTPVTLVSRPALFSPDIEDLKTGSYQQQLFAMKYFGYSQNKKAFWYMVKNLNRTFDTDAGDEWGVRFRKTAAESLGRIRDLRAVPFLVKRFEVESENTVLASIVSALSFYKSPAVFKVLKKGLASDDDKVRIESVKACALYGDKTFVVQIKQLLQKKPEKQDALAIYFALLKLGDEPDINADLIKKELKNRDPEIRYLAAYFLSMTERLEAIKYLLQALEIENYSWVGRQIESTLHILAQIKRKKIQEQNPYGY